MDTKRNWRGKRIGVMIESEVQFYSVQPILDIIKKNNAELVTFVQDFNRDDEGWYDIYNSGRKILAKHGWSPKTFKECDDKEFDIYLTPYMHGNEEINPKCIMKYEYGTTNVKPSLTYTPDVNEKIDVFLCQSTVNYEYLKVYGATYLVDNLRFFGLSKPKIKYGRKRILVAPTYNDDDEAHELLGIIRELKKEYYVITKAHHGTTYLKENLKKKEILADEADEFYTSETSLSELILGVDVCLFGNSSGFFEAMYAGVPCVLYAKDLDTFRLGEMHSTQYRLAGGGVLPWAKSVDEILTCVKQAMSANVRKKQAEAAQKLLPNVARNGVDGYVAILDFYLNDCLAEDYCNFHHYLMNEKDKQMKEAEEAKSQVYNLKNDIKVLRQELANNSKELGDIQEIMNGGLHRMASKIYQIRRKINGES